MVRTHWIHPNYISSNMLDCDVGDGGMNTTEIAGYFVRVERAIDEANREARERFFQALVEKTEVIVKDLDYKKSGRTV
jgi:hypothetical protein